MSRRKKLLFVDDSIPQYDTAAGARASFMYLCLLAGMGLDVTFLGTDFLPSEPYSRSLRALGVKVLDTPRHRRWWQLLLKLTLWRYNYVFFNRPRPTLLLLDLVERFSRARTFYQGHDLYSLRFRRSHELTGKPEDLRLAEEYAAWERDIYRRTDVILTFSEFEQGVIRTMVPGKPIEVVPLYFYEKMHPPIDNFARREHIFFVGGFRHLPNVDGVLWFAREVLPLVARERPGIKFLIAGSHPSPEIEALNGESIKVLGPIDDGQLEELYQNCRLAVIPLRFGAGVKGKTVEAIHHALPLVSTSIGLEGIPGIQALTRPADTPEEFSRRIIESYDDVAGLTACSMTFSTYAEKYLGFNTAVNTLSRVLGLS